MENEDRKKIQQNLRYLVENTKDFQKIFDNLNESGMFNPFMKQEILDKRQEDKLAFLYTYVTTRGPKAFRQLCLAFKMTNQPHLVEVLNRDSFQNSGASVFVTGHAFTELTLDEEYPYDQEDWKVTKGFERFDLDISNVYKMSTKPKGLVLIINIPSYINDTKPKRLGSDQDIKRLENIFGQLDYNLEVYNKELRASEIEIIVKNFANRSEHRLYDSSVVIMMSHGKDDCLSKTLNIEASDLQLVNSEWVVQQFSARYCKGLQGKPKLFFFQACRGERYQYPITYEEPPSPDKGKPQEELIIEQISSMSVDMSPNEVDGAPPKKPLKSGRADSDCIIGYATSHGHVAIRDKEQGSWYIQKLCQVIAKHAWNKDIASILRLVRRFEEDGVKSYTINQGFNKKLYFQPGLFDQIYASNGTS